MVDSVTVSFEWAFYIDLHSFKMLRVKNTVPVGSVVISKSKESDGARTYVTSRFHLAEGDGLVDKTKKEVSEVMSSRMLDYMQKRKTWPPNTFLGRTYKNGNVDINFEPSQYDKFSLTFTLSVVGGDVEMFLDELAPYTETDPSTIRFKVEPAKSGRAACHRCGANIPKNEIRIGEPSVFQEHVSYGWYHLACALHLLRGKSVEDLDGFDELSEEGQRTVTRTMEQKG